MGNVSFQYIKNKENPFLILERAFLSVCLSTVYTCNFPSWPQKTFPVSKPIFGIAKMSTTSDTTAAAAAEVVDTGDPKRSQATPFYQQQQRRRACLFIRKHSESFLINSIHLFGKEGALLVGKTKGGKKKKTPKTYLGGFSPFLGSSINHHRTKKRGRKCITGNDGARYYYCSSLEFPISE